MMMSTSCGDATVADIESAHLSRPSSEPEHLPDPPAAITASDPGPYVLLPPQPSALAHARGQACNTHEANTSTTAAAAPPPRHKPQPCPPKRTGLVLTPALTPQALASLADGCRLCIPGVSPTAMADWQRQHRHNVPHGFVYEYDALTRHFTIKSMPSAYHGHVVAFFRLSTITALFALPCFGRLLGASAQLLYARPMTLTGFGGGIDNLAHGSLKVPDFAIQALPPGVDFPAIVMECGFTQTLPSLIDAAHLFLSSTRTQTRLVILVMLEEAMSTTVVESRWPKSFVAEPVLAGLNASDKNKATEKKEVELAEWFRVNEKSTHGHSTAVRPLLGTITGTVYIYTRTNDTDIFGTLFPDYGPVPDRRFPDYGPVPDRRFPDISLIYSHTFMRDNVPAPVPDCGTDTNVLQIPLRMLYPPHIDPPKAVAASLDNLIITFSWAELANMVCDAKKGMIRFRAVQRAALVMHTWLEQSMLSENKENKENGRKRRRVVAGAHAGEEETDGQLNWTAHTKHHVNATAAVEVQEDMEREATAETTCDSDTNGDDETYCDIDSNRTTR